MQRRISKKIVGSKYEIQKKAPIRQIKNEIKGAFTIESPKGKGGLIKANILFGNYVESESPSKVKVKVLDYFKVNWY